MRVDERYRLTVNQFQNAVAKAPHHCPLTPQRPAPSDRSTCQDAVQWRASVVNSIDHNIRSARIIELVQRPGDHSYSLTETVLGRNQVSAAYAIPAQNWPRVVQNVKHRASRRPG